MIALSANAADAGKRLDSFLHERLPEYSRSRLQSWIKAGRVLVAGETAKASHLLRGSEPITVSPAAAPPLAAEPEDLPLKILYEDSEVIAIDKPAGLVVHAGAGHSRGTLVNALLGRFGSLSNGAGDGLRPGIVHRLDRDTSGVIVVARTDAAHQSLARQFHNRTVDKVYLALVEGRLKHSDGRITLPIARDPVRRTRMTTRLASGRSALTEYRLLEPFAGSTLLEVRIRTGRTHQIRVHLASLGHPVFGDRLYGAAAQPALGRFFLHAHRLSFALPASGNCLTIASPLPPELASVLATLRKNADRIESSK